MRIEIEVRATDPVTGRTSPSALSTVRVDGTLVDVGRPIEDGPYLTYRIDVEPRLAPPVHQARTHRDAKRTELDAAQGVAPRVGSYGHRALMAYRHEYETGGPGLTSFELAERLALEHYTVAPRVTELARGQWLQEAGKGRSPTSPKGAQRWKLSTAAIAAMELPPPPDGDQLDMLEET